MVRLLRYRLRYPGSMARDAVVFASMPMAVIGFAQSLGLAREQLLAAAGLTPDELADPDALVPYESLCSLWDLLLERFPDDPLGLRYAERIDASTIGVVGYVGKHSRDLRQAVETFARYCRLLDPYIVLEVQVMDALCRFTLDHEPRVTAMVQPIEMMIGSMALHVKRRVGQDLRPVEVWFRHQRRHDAALYQAFFGAPVSFGAPVTCLIYEAQVLDMPLVDSDPSLRVYLERHADSLLAAREAMPRAETLDARVRACIDECFLSGEVSQACVARKLGMSTRSLQRALKELGTSFTEQLDEVRRSRALELIRRPSMSLQELAFMLGYAEPRHFYRSFRRWTEMTPGEYRRSLAR